MHIKKLILASLAVTHLQLHSAQPPLHNITFFSPRSQGTNAARDAAGVQRYRDIFDACKTYGFFNITPEYTQSFKNKHNAQVLFGTNILEITGSEIADRNPQAILADYFGLSPKFDSVVRFSPSIQNAILAFDGYVGLDSWVRGLYLEIHAPLVWTKWHLEEHEIIADTGTQTPFFAEYMDFNEVQAPIQSFTQALTGDVEWGQMQDTLKFGKITDAHTKSGIADLQLACGWNFLLREHGHVGLNLRLTAPTGSRPKSEFLFEPIIGNGKHWEFGVGFNGRVLLWEKDGQQEFSFVGITNIMHLFKARQLRSFDFNKNGYNSRYMLLKEFNKNQQYTGVLTPAINKTTLPCGVRVDIRADIVTMFNYIYNAFSFDIGYNGFIQSKEKIKLRGCIPDMTYGLKGVQDVTQFGSLSNTTESNATIFGVDLSGTSDERTAKQEAVADDPSPVFITTNDLNIRSAASPRFLTHKLFTNFGYSWPHKTFPPFVGLGGEIEFEGLNAHDQAQPNHDTLSQWGVWVKVGARF